MTYLFGYTWIVGAVVVATDALPQELMTGASLIAIIGGCAAAIYTAKTRAQKTALQTQIDLERGAADAWKTERDAEVAKADRLAQELRLEAAARITAESRTDITRIERQVIDNHKQMLDNHQDVLTIVKSLQQLLEQIAKNTHPPIPTHPV